MVRFMRFKIEKLQERIPESTAEEAIDFIRDYMEKIDYEHLRQTMEVFILNEAMDKTTAEIDHE